MSRLRITSFGGMVPRLTNRHLQENQAQIAENCLLTSGALGPWRAKNYVATLATSSRVNSLFLHGKGTASERWLQWTTDVDAVKGPIAGDTTERTYFTGTDAPRYTNASLVDEGGNDRYPEDSYILGVPPSAVAPSVALAGAGSGPTYSRAYVYTFVTEFGEEGMPSVASSILGWQSGNTVDLTAIGKTITLTRSGSTVTANCTGHGYSTNDRILIGGADQKAYNGVWQITVIDANNFSYTISETPATPATGTIAAHKVAATTTVGKRSVTKKRIYRLATSVTGAEYLFVAEINIGTVTYNDSIADASLGEVLPSEDWAEPPSTLSGIIVLPNGVMAGFSGNQLYLTPPYVPYAYPTAYRQIFKDDIVAISFIGNTIFVLTKSIPYIVICQSPDQVMVTGLENDRFPCVSKQSVVRTPYGVLYASVNGIVSLSQAGVRNLTEELLTRREMEDYKPSTIRAYLYDGMYIGFYTRGLVSGLEDGGGFVFDPQNPLATWTTLDQYAYAGFFDEQAGDLYLSYWNGTSNIVYQWNGAGDYQSYTWRSRLFQGLQPNVFQAGRLHFFRNMSAAELAAYDAQRAASLAANAALLASPTTMIGPLGTQELGGVDAPIGYVNFEDVLPASPQSQGVTFKYYTDGDLKYQNTIYDNVPFRIPGGEQNYECEIELIGAAKITEVELATSISELSR